MRVAIQDIQAYRDDGEKFAMVTAYDYTSAQLVDRAGLPLILVGDSLGTVVQGHDTTIPVTLDDIIYHARMVVRGSRRAMIIGDLPFMTYPDVRRGLDSAAKLFQEGRVQAVKLEGADQMVGVVEAIVEHGIPVMGHLGYTPQSVHSFGKQIVRGKTVEQAQRLLTQARQLEQAGAFAIVLECVPSALAAMITSELQIPTIGIGSGPSTSGQVQVWHDMLGLYSDFVPRHAKQYAQLGNSIAEALEQYANEVKDGEFPSERNGSSMPEEALRALRDVHQFRTA